MRSLQERFEEKYEPVTESGCWIWTAYSNSKGYGRIGVEWLPNNRVRLAYAHRVSWEIHKGEIPKDVQVLHRCDVPACVNPSHLFLGTNTDNIADKLLKNRQHRMRGEKNGNSKITSTIATGIREMYSSGGISYRALAEKFNISKSQCFRIVNTKAWGHLI